MARDGRPRVLYLAFFFPPSRGSGVYRARATANHLVEHGWDVTVFAAPTYFLRDLIGSYDAALEATVDRRIRVERPRMRYYAWERDVRRFSRFRAALPALARRWHRWNLAHVFPEKYWSWALSCVRRGLALHGRRRFDLIVATGNPYASFAAAWLLGRALRVPYVLDYRDSWTLDQFNDRPAVPPGHPAWRWERRVLSRAAAVTFVNEAQRDWHARRYPDVAERMHVVINGFDAELLAESTRTRAAGQAPLRFTFLGTVIPSQPIEVLAEAFRLAQRDPVMAGAQVDVHGYLGYFHASARSLGERLASTGVIQYRGPVPKPEVGSVYDATDVLVFMTSGGRYVTTGKVFEYMATGLPIVSVHAPDTAAREVLAGYPLWFDPGGLDVDAVAAAIVEAARAARCLTPQLQEDARAHARAYARDRVLEPFSALLNRIAS